MRVCVRARTHLRGVRGACCVVCRVAPVARCGPGCPRVRSRGCGRAVCPLLQSLLGGYLPCGVGVGARCVRVPPFPLAGPCPRCAVAGVAVQAPCGVLWGL